jgi:CRISPR/Cas system CSM-associated protein Csm3 (group 7 of RAMP superfamily)
MLKATFLEGTICLTIAPNGPILIKAGESASADPTLPDMEFVRTRRGGRSQVYLPGSSLKGVVRAQCERICRSLDSAEQQQARLERRRALDAQEKPPRAEAEAPAALPPDAPVPLADNPLGRGETYSGPDDMQYSSGQYLETIARALRDWPGRTAIIYRRSSLVSQMFGNTGLAGRVRFADAYNDDPQPEDIEERNGVAIDRIYGSVAVGPFNYETVVAGTFETRIDFRNLTLAQLGLLGLGLRDLAEGRVGLGFGKSRGLGRVDVVFTTMELYYPACALAGDGALLRRGGEVVVPGGHLAGIGALCAGPAYSGYGFPNDDSAPLPEGLAYRDDELLGVRLKAEGDGQVRAIWRACMGAWKRELGL